MNVKEEENIVWLAVVMVVEKKKRRKTDAIEEKKEEGSVNVNHQHKRKKIIRTVMKGTHKKILNEEEKDAV